MLDTIFLEKAASSPVDNNKKILIRGRYNKRDVNKYERVQNLLPMCVILRRHWLGRRLRRRAEQWKNGVERVKEDNFNTFEFD